VRRRQMPPSVAPTTPKRSESGRSLTAVLPTVVDPDRTFHRRPVASADCSFHNSMLGLRPSSLSEGVVDRQNAGGGRLSVRRRDFAALFGCAVVGVPPAARAQQAERPRRVGALMAWPEEDPASRASVAAFTRALAGFGWAEGKNLHIDWRFAAGNPTLFDKYAAELVGLAPDAIFASTTQSAAPLRRQTSTIPIVFVLTVNPVELGFVQTLSRPGGNMTGFTSFYPSLMGKWVQLLKEISPNLERLTVIFNPETTRELAPALNGEIATAAQSVGMTVTFAPVRDDVSIEEVIAARAREPAGGLIALPDPFIASHRKVIIDAATHHRLPLISFHFFVRDGGLMSYWFDPFGQHGEAATYIDRVLRGASPGEMPVQYPTKFSLIINLTTAKAIGLSVPQSLLQRADEIIE
jgi:putative ABC transport system substrate-binding protein